MKYISSLFVLLFLMSITNSIINAQDQIPEMTPEQKIWMDYMTPGWAHKIMAESSGEWKTESIFWQSPDSEPAKSEGTASIQMILGGRYLQSVHKGNAWGMEMNGISTTAYDNSTNEFINTWIDNMGTGIAYSKGKYNKQNNSITFIGNMVDPMAGKEVKFKQVLKFIDDKNQLFEMYSFDNDKEIKIMEMKSIKK